MKRILCHSISKLVDMDKFSQFKVWIFRFVIYPGSTFHKSEEPGDMTALVNLR